MVRFNLRLTTREADAIYAAARKYGVDASPLLRQILRNALREHLGVDA